MPKTRISIIKGDEISQTDYRDSLPVNMTAVQRPILGADGYMMSHPGLTQLGTGIGIDRGGEWNERLAEHLRVSGQRLISVAANGTVTEIGTISGSDRSSMTYSFNTQAIVADGRMWLYNGTTLSEITDPDLGDPIDVTWIDGYYFLTDGEFLYHTDITDETSIDPLKFATAEFSPDPTLAVDKTSDNQVVAFGRYSTEFFINRATDNFAFQRVQGKALKVGVVGTHAETELDGSFFIVGSTKEEAVSVHIIGSGTYQSIATREVDKILAEYTDTELATTVVETRVEDADRFLLIRLPRHTLLYNHTIGKSLGTSVAWSIIKSDVLGDTKWRGVNGVFDPRIPAWVYGDDTDETIGRLDNTVGSQYGNQTEFIIYSPLVDMESASINEVSIDSAPGHMLNTDNVNVSMSLTYDGVTFGTEYFKLYGQQYNYNTRYIVRRLGYVSDFVGFKFRTVTKEKLNFAGLEIDYG